MSVINKSAALLLSTTLLIGLSGCNEGKEPTAATEGDKAPALQSDLQKFSYSVGVLMATDMRNKGIDGLDEVAMGEAIRDVLDGKPLQLDEQQMEAALEQAARQLMEAQVAETAAAAEQAKAAGAAYLAENGKREGVTTLPSGIQYKVLTEGSGAQPTLESTVVAHYHGTLIDGTVFDSSYDRGAPATFALARVVQGWQEVLPLMPVGSKWQVAIPSELAYGETGAPPKIGGNETLLFDIELIEIKQPEAQQ
ncbi:MAG: FKBP-type peptidyl-prolyl cis-trans isomerase [Gammaproteobacteria bacterium]|nr:FKBP-type peptidyl-prolyl cis-trans isomerase [Gammaproteobacteria bacterium]